MLKIENYGKKYLDEGIREILSSRRNDEIPELSVFEKAIIYKYSNDGYENINEHLRINKGRKNTEFGKLLDLALSKLSDYEGLVYRGVNLNKNELSRYKEALRLSQFISEYSFISTSKSRLIAMEYRGNTLFRIYSRTGKEIDKIAKFGEYSPSNEKEVLFRLNRSFKVLEVTNQVDYTLITMEESL